MEADREKNKDSIRRDRKGTGGNIWVEQKKGKEDGEVECIEKKKKVRRKLRKQKGERGKEQEYKRMKREYKELSKSKKKEENNKWKRAVEGNKKKCGKL